MSLAACPAPHKAKRPVAAYIIGGLSPMDSSTDAKRQLRDITAYAILRGYEIYDLYRDDFNYQDEIATTHGLDSLLKATASHAFDLVLVSDWLGLTRVQPSLQEMCTRMEPLGIQVVEIESEVRCGDADEEIMHFIAASLSSYEKRLRSVQHAAGRTASLQKQQFPGGCVPYGYRYSTETHRPGIGHLEIDPQAAEVIKLIFELKNEGCGIREIARRLNSLGYKTAHGKSFTGVQVSNVLQKENFYRGLEPLKQVAASGAQPTHDPILQ